MAKKKRPASKSAPKQSPRKKAAKKPRCSAHEEFAAKCEYYRGEDIKAMRRKLTGKTFTVASLDKHEFDNGEYAWLMGTEELEKPFKVNDKNGRNLAEEFEDDLETWVGRQLTITATEYGTGWGVLMDPMVDDEAEDEYDDDLPADEDDEIE